MHGKMDGWGNGAIDGKMNGWMDGWMDGWRNGGMVGLKDGQMKAACWTYAKNVLLVKLQHIYPV